MADPELRFKLEEASRLAESLDIIQNFNPDMVTVKFSSSMIALIFGISSSNYLVALTLKGGVFTEFSCSSSEDYFSLIKFERIYTLLNDMLADGYGSFTASITDLNWVDFTFHRRVGSNNIEVLPVLPSTNEKDLCDYDASRFVIISPNQFLDVVRQFSEYNSVLIRVMNGQIRFCHGSSIQIYYAERNQCKIRGMVENDELRFFISLNPKDPCIDLAMSAISITFYKAVNSSDGVIEFRMDMPNTFLMYKPSL